MHKRHVDTERGSDNDSGSDNGSYSGGAACLYCLAEYLVVAQKHSLIQAWDPR